MHLTKKWWYGLLLVVGYQIITLTVLGCKFGFGGMIYLFSLYAGGSGDTLDMASIYHTMKNFGGAGRFMEFDEVMSKKHPKEPHYYLLAIGTRDHAKGKGYASKCIRHVTKKADEEKIGCYLENSNPLNTPLYERYGFKTTDTCYFDNKKVQVLCMWREPQQ